MFHFTFHDTMVHSGTMQSTIHTPVRSPVRITNWNIWSMIFAFDPDVKVTKSDFLMCFLRLLACMVHLLVKSVKPFRVYRLIKYLTLDFDFRTCDQVHKMYFLCCFFNSFYMVQYLAKLVKLIRFYHKLKYYTFDFGLWPLGQGHKICFSISLL